MKYLITFLFSALLVPVFSQEESVIAPSRVVFYNVENLFDTINDPSINDEDFLPDSEGKWNSKKYHIKLNHIAKVLSSLFDTIQPLVVGLSEIENERVLLDLIAHPYLQKFHFRIIHIDSPDERGIDCAILYNEDLITPSFFTRLSVDLGNEDKTRDVLYFKGHITEQENIWFFVNHWPSRRGGEKNTEQNRQIVSKILGDKIDNILLGDPQAHIVVMGDFNDNPGNKSVDQLSDYSKRGKLVNLMKPIADRGEFTLKYMSEKDVFDQFIVTQNFVQSQFMMEIRNHSAYVFNPEWLLYNHKKYGLIPNRTYASGRWVGGYSDHLPVYFDVVFK